ncbi:fungal specific transcription factor [Pochonia chlamydosporia 170]|uniref:Fungal specific transcription factor n=1 Tax=Pochonia chlamydosporia 170 TaxID=1380566 RepID=A0A179EVZ9_METCM|nr:fungal specific transcription factor [Pochonia chlamydosporia 170]OAQ57342.2 fungal specific transcription factor [Pochonia chlamydosporia 170]
MQLSDRFGLPRNVTTPEDIQVYQSTFELWMGNLPPIYDFTNPNKRDDDSQPWIILHHHYLQTVSYSMVLGPFKGYLSRPMSRRSPSADLKIRCNGINYSLKLMEALRELFGYIYPNDANFYLLLFNIFDTAVVLCSSISNDQDGSIPRRPEILHAIDEALAMLKRLRRVHSKARAAYELLAKIIQRTCQPMNLPGETWACPLETALPIERGGPMSAQHPIDPSQHVDDATFANHFDCCRRDRKPTPSFLTTVG